jgi:hypothetical protein
MVEETVVVVLVLKWKDGIIDEVVQGRDVSQQFWG